MSQNDKMLQHDVADKNNDVIVDNDCWGIIQEKKRKEKQEILGYNIIKKAVCEERKENEEKIESVIHDGLEERKIENYCIDNFDGSFLVAISLPNEIIDKTITESIKRYGGRGYESKIIEIVLRDYFYEKEKQHHVTSLLYDGREPRKDVIKKLQIISDLLKIQSTYPLFRKSLVETIIGEILGKCDKRTSKKYYDCINNCIYIVTRNKLNYYDDVDISSFVSVLESKLLEM